MGAGNEDSINVQGASDREKYLSVFGKNLKADCMGLIIGRQSSSAKELVAQEVRAETSRAVEG